MNEPQDTSENFLVKVIATGTLKLGQFELDCAVIEGEDKKPIRVLSSRKFQKALDISSKNKNGLVYIETTPENDEKNHGVSLPAFLASQTLRQFITQETMDHCKLYKFKNAKGMTSHAYTAELLAEVCEVYLCARDAGVLLPHQLHIAERCDKLMRAFARVGLNALVDEATGYQAQRSTDALQRMIDEYLGKNAAAWLLTFEGEFYQEAFRLHGLRYDPKKYGSKRPMIIGQFTNQVIYSLILPPPVHHELKSRNTKKPCGRWRQNHHQWLTSDRGRVELQAQLKTVLWLMRGSATLEQFWRRLRDGMPGSQMAWPFFDDELPGNNTDGLHGLVAS